MDWLTTSTILAGLRDPSDGQAWRRLDARFRRPIVSFARRMGLSSADAEDVAQETLVQFADAYRKGKFDRQKGRLSHWLFGIAYRQALSGRRRQQRQGARGGAGNASSFLAELPDEDVASRSWDYEWEQALLDQCLRHVADEVEPTTFQAFQLVVGQSRSASEAAQTLGVTVKSVYNAKHRVLKRIRELRAALEESG